MRPEQACPLHAKTRAAWGLLYTSLRKRGSNDGAGDCNHADGGNWIFTDLSSLWGRIGGSGNNFRRRQIAGAIANSYKTPGQGDQMPSTEGAE